MRGRSAQHLRVIDARCRFLTARERVEQADEIAGVALIYEADERDARGAR